MVNHEIRTELVNILDGLSDEQVTVLIQVAKAMRPSETSLAGDKQQEATAFIAKRTSICPHCRKTLREGQAAVASQGKWLHAECYDQIVESGS